MRKEGEMSPIIRATCEVNDEVISALQRMSGSTYNWRDIFRQLEVVIPSDDADKIVGAMIRAFKTRRKENPDEPATVAFRDAVLHTLLVGIRLGKRGLV